LDYTVAKGDTLGKIAQKHGTSVNVILSRNPAVTDPGRISVGQRLMIPDPVVRTTAGGGARPTADRSMAGPVGVLLIVTARMSEILASVSAWFGDGDTPAAGQATIALDKAQEIALKITTYFEGGVAMNYQALADDFDGQATSFGLIQWNFGSGTLGPLLKKMLDKDPTAFAGCFGEDADFKTLKSALTLADKTAQAKWARALLKSKRSAWESAFKNIGSNETFKKIQRDEAVAEYHPLAVAAIKEVRDISPALFKQVELRSYVALFDLCVQQGGIAKFAKAIKTTVEAEKPQSQLELMKIVVTVRGRGAKAEWASDCISRRMGILQGSSYKSTENAVTKERKNTQLTLLANSGGSYVSGL
jgi:LysM repeat protein